MARRRRSHPRGHRRHAARGVRRARRRAWNAPTTRPVRSGRGGRTGSPPASSRWPWRGTRPDRASSSTAAASTPTPTLHVTIEREDGVVETWRDTDCTVRTIGDGPEPDTLALEVTLPHALPFGAHALTVEGRGLRGPRDGAGRALAAGRRRPVASLGHLRAAVRPARSGTARGGRLRLAAPVRVLGRSARRRSGRHAAAPRDVRRPRSRTVRHESVRAGEPAVLERGVSRSCARSTGVDARAVDHAAGSGRAERRPGRAGGPDPRRARAARGSAPRPSPRCASGSRNVPT